MDDLEDEPDDPTQDERLEEWGEWMRETLLLDVPHRQVVFVIPKTLRIFHGSLL